MPTDSPAADARQLALLTWYGLLTYPFACVPFLYFYFAAQGIAFDRYLWLIACYYWAMVLTEVPTGVLADRFGRRLCLAVGSFTLATGFLVLLLGRGLGVFCTGEALLGVGHAMLSGAPTALLYDSLGGAQRGRFLHAESRIHAMRLLGTGGSFLLGGVLAWQVGIPVTIGCTALLCATAGVLALALTEPPRHTAPGHPLLRGALRDLRRGPMLWLIGYFALLFGLLRFAFHTYQPYLRDVLLGNTESIRWLWVGALFAALNLVAAPCSRLAPVLGRRVATERVLPWLPLVLCATFVAMGSVPGWLGAVLLFVHQVPFGLHWALVQDYVNARVESPSRATALSLLSMSGRVSFAAWLPLLGEYERGHGTPSTYALVGWVGLGLTALWCAPPARLLVRPRD
ncbi:MAG: MFS transporter [Planctomycetes bacterium]|nr:MFS transporter [Planctomycetota bacterium]